MSKCTDINGVNFTPFYFVLMLKIYCTKRNKIPRYPYKKYNQNN